MSLETLTEKIWDLSLTQTMCYVHFGVDFLFNELELFGMGSLC